MNDRHTPAWESWRGLSVECSDAGAYRRRFRSFADELSELFPPRLDVSGPQRSLAREWSPLGVNVIRTKLQASGGCVMRDGFADVYVNEEEPIQRIRYTAGHELGHLLLDVNTVAKDLGITGAAEEALCNVFASRMLIGRGHLRRCVAERTRLAPSEYLELCRRFGVSLSAMANALAEVWRPHWGLLVVGRRDMDESQGDYQVSAAACSRPWFVPKGLKFSKLGLASVTSWMREECAGERTGGSSTNVSVVLWDPESDVRRSGRATIKGRYEALRLRNGHVVVSLTWRPRDAALYWFERSRSSPEGGE